MAFLRSSSTSDSEPILQTERLYLRYPLLADYSAWAALRKESRAYLAPWEPSWTIDELTKPAFRRRLRHYARDIREDEAYPYFIFRNRDDVLVGGCILSNIRRGVSQSCSIGYWIGERYSGQGYMTETVAAVARHVFGPLSLHRIEAACLADNEASQNVLRKVGFVEEGCARNYLKINGQWRDHLLFALLEIDMT